MMAFRFTSENALLFFELCRDLNANTEEKRLAIIDAMVQAGKVEQVTQTNRTKEEYIHDLSQHFKILDIQSSGSIPTSERDDPKGDSNGR